MMPQAPPGAPPVGQVNYQVLCQPTPDGNAVNVTISCANMIQIAYLLPLGMIEKFIAALQKAKADAPKIVVPGMSVPVVGPTDPTAKH